MNHLHNSTTTLLKNAISSKKSHVIVNGTPLTSRIFITLTKAGFIRGFQKIICKDGAKFKVLLKYGTELQPTIKALVSISTVARRRSLKRVQAVTSKNAFCLPVFNHHQKKTNLNFGYCLFIIKQRSRQLVESGLWHVF